MKNLTLQSAELVKPVSVNGCTVTMCLFNANEVVEAWAGSTEAAQRIVACVNACSGASTELLEKGMRHDWAELMTELETQRDELLAALEKLYEFSGHDNEDEYAVIMAVEALIARVKGGAA